jgi:putative transposase
VAGSIRSKRVIEVLAKLISVRGAPTYLRYDNGPEFVSQAILEWLAAENIYTPHRSRQDVAERRRRKLQRQVPRRMSVDGIVPHWAEANAVNEAWRRHYNHVRTLRSLKDRTPIEFAALYHSTHEGAVLQL